MNEAIKHISNFFLDIFFPKKCVQCGKYGDLVCMDCVKKIELIKTSTCPFCGKITKFGKICLNCRAKNKSPLSALIIAAQYDAGPTKEMIHNLKYSGFTLLAECLGELVCQKLRTDETDLKNTVLVPVPLHIKREKKRGFNQAELMGRYVSKNLNIPGGNALVRCRDTVTQVGLKRSERIKNLSGAFLCDDADFIKDKTVILIDDVSTSGATLSECARVLKENGARNIIGVVVARRI